MGGPGDEAGNAAAVKHEEISFVMIDANNMPNDPAAVAALYGSQVKGVYLNTENSRIPSGRGRRSSSFGGFPDSLGIPLPNELKSYHEILMMLM